MSSFKMTMSLPFCNYATSVSRKCSFISEPTGWGRKVSGLTYCICMQVALVEKDPPADAGDLRDTGLGWEKGMAAHSSFVAWRIPLTEHPGLLHGVMKNWTWLKQLSMHACTYCTLLFTFFFFFRFFCSEKFKENNHRGKNIRIQNPIANRFFEMP